MNRFNFLPILTALIAFSCIEGDGETGQVPPGSTIYEPVYVQTDVAHLISKKPAKSVAQPGKIVIYQNYLLINAIGQGFHVIDNTNPSMPVSLFFVEIPGSHDVALKDGYLYADNYNDIVVLSIDENQEIELVARLDNLMNNQEYPPFSNVYFDCVDRTKGIVVDWVVSDNTNVKCFRP